VRIGDVVGVAVVIVVVVVVVVFDDDDDDDASVVEVEVWVEVEEVEVWVEVEKEEGWVDDEVEEVTGLTLELEADYAVLVVELGEMEMVAGREAVLEVPGAETVVEEELSNDDRLVDTVVELEALLEGRRVVGDADLNVFDEVSGCETLDDGKVKAEEL
jgi:hypothetical protein